MNKVNIVVKMEMLSECMDELAPMLDEFREATLHSPGLDYFNVAQDDENPSLLYIIERWQSQQHFEKHIASSYFKEFGSKGKNMFRTRSITRLLPFFK